MSRKISAFDPFTIRGLFGAFDAEEETPERFKEFFVTNGFYQSFAADFPLRVAVGNKGTGKTALLRALYNDHQNRPDCICVSLSGTDLDARVGDLPDTEAKAVNHWKTVFAREAASQAFTANLSEKYDEDASGRLSSLPDFVSWLSELASNFSKGGSDIAIKAGFNLSEVSEVIFFIDDVDRTWNGQPDGLHFVNSMLNSAYEITKRESNIKFRIGLRWDLWDALSGINQDIDKIRQNTVFLNWSNHEIYLVVANRIATYFGVDFSYETYLEDDSSQDQIEKIYDPILERRFQGYGKWANAPMRHVLLSMVRNRPRDLISLLTLAAEEAASKKRIKINSTDLQNIFPRYSEERLNDLSVEYGTRLDGLKTLLLSFKPSSSTGKATEKFRYTNDAITVHLKDFLRTYGNRVRFKGEVLAPDFRQLLDFLFKIDFLQAWYKHADGRIERVNFQDRQLAVSPDADFGYSWEVLPAYRWAIQPTKIEDVISSLY